LVSGMGLGVFGNFKFTSSCLKEFELAYKNIFSIAYEFAASLFPESLIFRPLLLLLSPLLCLKKCDNGVV
jgi:hypothetical protein